MEYKYYKDKNKEIYCPKCRKLLTVADKRDPNQHKLMCKHCRKWIWYTPKSKEKPEIHEVPNSKTSSGMTFY